MKRADALDLANYVAALDTGAVDPTAGLPDPIFQLALHITPMINVDLLVKDADGRTLVAWRDDPFGTGWHIPGGIIRLRESFADRIAAVGRLELGVEVAAEAEPCRVSQLLDSGRGHFISLLFRCALRQPLDEVRFAADAFSAQSGQLHWAAAAPEPLYPAHEYYRDLFRA